MTQKESGNKILPKFNLKVGRRIALINYNKALIFEILFLSHKLEKSKTKNLEARVLTDKEAPYFINRIKNGFKTR